MDEILHHLSMACAFKRSSPPRPPDLILKYDVCSGENQNDVTAMFPRSARHHLMDLYSVFRRCPRGPRVRALDPDARPVYPILKEGGRGGRGRGSKKKHVVEVVQDFVHQL